MNGPCRLPSGPVGRRTIPLIFGDGPARRAIAAPVLFWTVLCPWYWNSAALGYVVLAVLGVIVSLRTIVLRSVEEDRTTWRIYSAWLVAIYSLPVLSGYRPA